jgi:hypothetical protein
MTEEESLCRTSTLRPSIELCSRRSMCNTRSPFFRQGLFFPSHGPHIRDLSTKHSLERCIPMGAYMFNEGPIEERAKVVSRELRLDYFLHVTIRHHISRIGKVGKLNRNDYCKIATHSRYKGVYCLS